jgi:predicted aspartyl protease
MSYISYLKTNYTSTFDNNLLYLKYGVMSNITYPFIESNLPFDNFNKLPIILINVATKDKSVECYGLIDTGATISIIDVDVAKHLNSIIIDTSITSTVVGVEQKPVINIQLNTEALDKQWISLNVSVADLKHCNIQMLLGRDFLEYFILEFNQKEKFLTLKF